MSHENSISPEMSPAELRAALATLGISQGELARVTGAGLASAQRWVAEDGSVPGAVAIVVRLALIHPSVRKDLGLKRKSRRGRPPAI